MTIEACISQAYKASKGSKNFKRDFVDQLAHHLQTGMRQELSQRQIAELEQRIWYTAELMKPTFKGKTGPFLKCVQQVTEKYVLTELDNTPRPKRDILDHPKNSHMRNSWGVPSHRDAILKEQGHRQ